MFPILRARWDAMTLTRALHKSLLESRDQWRMRGGRNDRAVLTHGDFQIELIPRAVRLLDAVHLYRNDAEVWLPLFSRMRLRAAARLKLIQMANNRVAKPKNGTRQVRPRRRVRAV